MTHHTLQRSRWQRLLRARLTPIVAAAALAVAFGAWLGHEPRVQAAAVGQAAVGLAPAATRVPPTVDSYADLVSRVAPAVVTIRSVRTVKTVDFPMPEDLRRFFGDGPGMRAVPRREGGLGSGVVVAPDGYILTNNHVVEGADRIRVDFTDGRSLEAKVVGTDKPSDLAVLKVAAAGLATLPLGDARHARVGDVVLAIGNPLGVGQTVTLGIISGKGRATGASDGAFEDFIQTDAPINQGNSGGALINTRGELIGINSQILSPVGYNIGIGFAIPADMAQYVMHQLIESGRVRRGMLGVTVQPVNADMAKSLRLGEAQGAIVSEVQPDTPASRAGLQTGDVIVALDGDPVSSSNDLRNHVARRGPDATVTLTIVRDGHERQVSARLAELPDDRVTARRRAEDDGRATYGMAVEPLTPELATQLGVDRSTRGVVVDDLDPSGRGAEAGLQSGDVIERVNGQTVTDVQQLEAALGGSRDARPALVLVNRQGHRLFVTLEHDRG